MSNTVISVDSVSKHYRLGTIGGHTLREDVQRWWHKVRGHPDPLAKIGQSERRIFDNEVIWALNDLSFEVKSGDILGIVGQNGAGKSTLLKILARITAPSQGMVKICGRVGSLLEVGTGFHPELTGRENIFLNGSILGMSKSEIQQKLDEIVDFSGVEAYIDTPVKRYSSGMHVRLAFAVAAHLEPEILLVDEVLAVGDYRFQQKCLDKMEDITRVGRTILFVSHNLSAVRALCKRALLLHDGTLKRDGDTSSIISEYVQLQGTKNDIDYAIVPQRGQDTGVIRKIEWAGHSSAAWRIPYGGNLQFKVFIHHSNFLRANLELRIRDFNGTPVALIAPGHFSKQMFDLCGDKNNELHAEIGPMNLASGRYFADISICNTNTENYGEWFRAFEFTVEESDPCNIGFDYRHVENNGFVYIPHTVTHQLRT